MVSQNALRASAERCIIRYREGICLHLNISEMAQMMYILLVRLGKVPIMHANRF